MSLKASSQNPKLLPSAGEAADETFTELDPRGQRRGPGSSGVRESPCSVRAGARRSPRPRARWFQGSVKTGADPGGARASASAMLSGF